MTGWLSDIRFGLRLLRRSPEVIVVAVLAMAIAVGVAGTVFSVTNAVLIQPLTFSDPERLVAIWQRSNQIQSIARSKTLNSEL